MKPDSFAKNDPSSVVAPTPKLDDDAPTRSSLILKLRSWDDKSSWQRFFDTYWRLIYTVARRTGLSDFEAQEVVQETVIAVARAVKDFEYDRAKGSFRGWLTRWASWRIKDQFRKRSREHEAVQQRRDGDSEARTDWVERVPDPENTLDQLWQEEWDRKLREVVLRRVKDLTTPRQYQIFDCYVLKGWPVSRVVQDLGVSTASVYLARTRVSRLIRTEMAHVENGLL